MSIWAASSSANTWIDRSAFYEQRAGYRRRENERFYQRLIRQYYGFLVSPDRSVLEVGCGLGDLLAEVKPARGVGIDFSPKMVSLARQRHPAIEFHTGDAAHWRFSEKFDYILLADLINDLPDVQAVLAHLRQLSHSRTRLVLNFLNTLWRPALAVAESIGAKAPSLLQNWLSTSDVKNLLHLAGWEVIKVEHRILWPLPTPGLSSFLNRWLAPWLPDFCLTIFIVARPRTGVEPSPLESARASETASEAALQTSVSPAKHYHCSVVIPARNEAGNIESAVLRTPELGLGTELIFVEGNSRDETWREMQRVAKKYPARRIKLLRQSGTGKGSAVREGFSAATGELLFILDCDLSVPPEELSKFYEVARSGTADFVNGVRLVYPMEHEAMRFLNMIANKLFGMTFSWLLGQPIKDTLCGTKVLFRADYEQIVKNRNYFGEFDPFGDFDLLFGAAKTNLRLLDLPIRYQARTYGETNIRRWRHGWLLLRMVCFAARRLKFV